MILKSGNRFSDKIMRKELFAATPKAVWLRWRIG
jgi:hypothetical protein